MTVVFKQKTASAWADSGHEIAWMQTELKNSGTLSIPQVPSASTYMQVNSSKLEHIISGHGFSFNFDRARGQLTKWISHGQKIFISDPSTGSALTPSFWRAPTDNDMPSELPYWQRFGVDAMTPQLRSFDISAEENCVKLNIHTYLELHLPTLNLIPFSNPRPTSRASHTRNLSINPPKHSILLH